MRVRKDTVILERRYIPKGARIIKEGEYGAQAFLIQSGAVRVFIEHDGIDTTLGKLGIGEIFGEMALIFDGPRSANVEAIQDCNLIIITRQQFEDKLKNTDSTIRAVLNMVTRRIMDVNNTLIQRRADLGGLTESGRIIYQNIAASLDSDDLKRFQKAVLPNLNSFLNAVEEFYNGLPDKKSDEDKALSELIDELEESALYSEDRIARFEKIKKDLSAD